MSYTTRLFLPQGIFNQPNLAMHFPQGTRGGSEPTFNTEDNIINGIRSTVEFLINTNRDSVDFQVTV